MIDKNFIFDITEYPKDIAILFSGGADSALLFYLCSSQILNLNLNIKLSLYVIDRHNGPIPYANLVYEQICDTIGSNQFPLITLDIPPTPNGNQVSVASNQIKNNTQHEVLLWGINQYPDDTTIRPKVISEFIETDFIRMPFKHYTKDIIIEQFYRSGIEDILHNTHSCGWRTEGYCERCFNCRERIWAYNKLGQAVNLGK